MQNSVGGNQGSGEASQSKSVSRNKGLSNANSKNDPIADEYKNFYVFPHEYLCLICNAKDRVNMLENAFKLNFALEKELISNNLQPMKHQINANSFIVYNLTKAEEGDWRDWRPTKILNAELEADFYDNIPQNDDGMAFTNKRAGINPTKKSRALNISRT